jgi:hypothetical protein
MNPIKVSEPCLFHKEHPKECSPCEWKERCKFVFFYILKSEYYHKHKIPLLLYPNERISEYILDQCLQKGGYNIENEYNKNKRELSLL